MVYINYRQRKLTGRKQKPCPWWKRQLAKVAISNIKLVQCRFESCPDMVLWMLPGIHILRSLLKLLTAIYLKNNFQLLKGICTTSGWLMQLFPKPSKPLLWQLSWQSTSKKGLLKSFTAILWQSTRLRWLSQVRFLSRQGEWKGGQRVKAHIRLY